MNNEQMVSVPRERLREFIENAACLGRSPQWVKNKAALLEALAQPAAQYHGEPVAWVRVIAGEPNQFSWFAGKQLPTGKHQLYTHADAGEVERLRDLLSEVLNEVPHGWGESFSESDLAGRIRDALEVES